MQRQLRRLAGIAVAHDHASRVARHRDVVPAVPRRERDRFARGPVVEVRDVELALERGLLRGHEVHAPAPLVHAAHRRRLPLAVDVPVARGDRALQHAVVVVAVEVVVAAAFRGPQDLAPLGQEVQVAVQRNPGVAALREKLRACAAGDREGNRVQALLIARLDLHQHPVAGGKPVDAREVMVLAPKLGPGDLAAGEREDREAHLGIGLPGRGIALAEALHAVGGDLEALHFRDRRLVHARVGDVPLVGRPPVAGVAVHLFLRDELRDAVAHQPAAARRQPPFDARCEFDRVQVLVADEAHVTAARRVAGIRLERLGGGQAAHGLARGLAERVVIQVAAEREQQRLRIRRPLVFDDAAQRRDALPLAPRFLFGRQGALGRRQHARVHQQPVPAGGDVVSPEVVDGRGVVAPAQVGDQPPVRREARQAQRGAGEIGGLEQPLDGEVRRERGPQGKARRESGHE